MSSKPRPQRIRDPVHNLIEFGVDDFDFAIWKLIQSRPFQRLRRIRQLGFSEFVYPGATHTRFAHSVGVFHTARRLMDIVKIQSGKRNRIYQENWARIALVAALVHDLGHGMFSHAFEEVAKRLKRKLNLDIPLAKHEVVTGLLIRNSEIAKILDRSFGGGFANEVATVIDRGSPTRIYDSVVSSQFDADRLDYMQRDRLMTGIESSRIDLEWLLANLEIGIVRTGVDVEETGEIETFVLGPKAILAAEAYVLALFQLYPTVYFHKATRGAELLFTAIMVQIVELVRNGTEDKSGLPKNHPIVQFAREPDKLDNVLHLDDAIFWGSLPFLCDSPDPLIKEYAGRLYHRQLLKSVDIRDLLLSKLPLRRNASSQERRERQARVDRGCERIRGHLERWSIEKSTNAPRILIDQAQRDPYKRFQDSTIPLNQIHIRAEGDNIVDVAERSPVVAELETFRLFRAYLDRGDAQAASAVTKIIDEELEKGEKSSR